MNTRKKAFTFVELLISISIVILISVIAVTSLNNNNQKVNNAKVDAGTKTLKNAFLNYLQEKSNLPSPDGNKNYFKSDSSYGHSTDTDNFGVYGSITENTLPKKYLDNLPLDPVSNHYYSYGKTLDNKYFEIASILRKTESNKTKLDGNYPGEFGPVSLIREYNGDIFVSDSNQKHLPYNPEEHKITATDQDGKVYYPGQKIENSSKALTLYFSDGSVSELATGSTLDFSELKYKKQDNNLLTSIKLFLSSGEILTKATSLNEGSDFEIYTLDTTAAVRGTIFSVSYNSTTKTEVAVIKGTVEVEPKQNTATNLNPIEESSPDKKEVRDGEIIKSALSSGCFIDGKLVSGEILGTDSIILYMSGTPGTPGMPGMHGMHGCSNSNINAFTVVELDNKITEKLNKNIIKINTLNLPKGKKNILNNGIEGFIDNQELDGMKIYTLASYNIDKNLLSYTGGIIEGTGSFNIDLKGNLYASGSNYFLKYSNLDLENNFAIEMRVRFPDIPRGTRYLFQLGNYKAYLSSTGKIYLKNNTQNINQNITSYYDGNFHIITAIKNGNNYTLKIDGKDIGNFTSSNSIGLELYIGSKNDKRYQINDIIDYMKIYKKD